MVGRLIVFFTLFLAASGFAQVTPEQTQEIIRHSAQATHADWERAPDFSGQTRIDCGLSGSRGTWDAV